MNRVGRGKGTVIADAGIVDQEIDRLVREQGSEMHRLLET